jgi:hypothetical protein
VAMCGPVVGNLSIYNVAVGDTNVDKAPRTLFPYWL